MCHPIYADFDCWTLIAASDSQVIRVLGKLSDRPMNLGLEQKVFSIRPSQLLEQPQTIQSQPSKQPRGWRLRLLFTHHGNTQGFPRDCSGQTTRSRLSQARTSQLVSTLKSSNSPKTNPKIHTSLCLPFLEEILTISKTSSRSKSAEPPLFLTAI